MNLKGGSTEGV